MKRIGSSRRRAAVGTAVGALVVTALAAAGAPADGVTTAGLAKAQAVSARKAGPAPAWLTTMRAQAVIHKRHGQLVTVGPDPRLATGPGVRDVAGWARKEALEKEAAQADTGGGVSTQSRRSSGTVKPPSGSGRRAVTESEPAGTRGGNDTLATAQRIPGFGTRRPAKNAADVTGDQAAAPRPTLAKIKPNVEDDSTFETAGVTGVSTVRGGATTTGFVGDNPPNPDEPGATDADLYALDLTAGQILDVDLRTTSGDLEPIIFLLDEQGNFLADSFFDPDFFNPSIQAPVKTTGRYYVGVQGFTIIDLGTGKVTVSKGNYALDLAARAGDTDTYKVALAAGDVLGTNVAGSGKVVTLLDATGTELMGSAQDASGIYPTNTPLPGGGNAVAETVAPKKGTYYVQVSGGDGPYTLQVEAYRPGGTGKVRQTVFLDYDGQRLNTNSVFGRGVTTLSPLSSFLPGWGIKAGDRKALGRKIKATVVENLQKDLVASGLSTTVSVKVVTSDEVKKDPYGGQGVMRVVVGGTIDESGVATIGIAPSIDPGNFAREESALVLLDALSEPGTLGDVENSPPYSLNTYMGPRSDRVRFVGQAVGNVVSHEVGHTLGSFHTDNTDEQASLMDAGGFGYGNLFGVGPDGVGGTADDRDVDFVTDTFDLFEGFTGQENTLARTTWALSR